MQFIKAAPSIFLYALISDPKVSRFEVYVVETPS